MLNRIGLFGGSFDPVHTGHLIIANIIFYELELDRVIFIPNFLSPFKKDKNTADISHRIRMIELSVRDNPAFGVCSFEADLKRPVYSYETVEFFKNNYKSAELFMILGRDSFGQIKKWKNYEYLKNSVTFVTAPRDYNDTSDQGDLPGHIESTMCPRIGISSTMVRKRIAEKNNIKYLVNEEVRRYINDNGLYLE